MGLGLSTVGLDARANSEAEARATEDFGAEGKIQDVTFIDSDSFSIIDTLLFQKKELFKESAKMEHCLQRLRSYLTTE